MITRNPRSAALARKIRGRVRSAMGGKNVMLVGDAELVKGLDAMTHRFPIRRAAHDDADER